MGTDEHKAWVRQRDQALLQTHWPSVAKRLLVGMTPEVIVREMFQEGYWGFGGNRVRVADVSRLWELAAKAGLWASNSPAPAGS